MSHISHVKWALQPMHASGIRKKWQHNVTDMSSLSNVTGIRWHLMDCMILLCPPSGLKLLACGQLKYGEANRETLQTVLLHR